jgi:hypothetical protein
MAEKQTKLSLKKETIRTFAARLAVGAAKASPLMLALMAPDCSFSGPTGLYCG